MTTQVLMPISVVAQPLLPVVLPHDEKTEVPPPSAAPQSITFVSERLVAPSSCPLPTADLDRRLPYRPRHQAELLCLQAEADALLHHLQALKQDKPALSAQG